MPPVSVNMIPHVVVSSRVLDSHTWLLYRRSYAGVMVISGNVVDASSVISNNLIIFHVCIMCLRCLLAFIESWRGSPTRGRFC